MNPSTAQARVVVDELIRHDVRDAVVCPGSRSAPLALALAAADRAGRIRVHVRIDERGAGFLALGLAVATARPVPVLVTSGTAVANLHPAMVEASHSGIPVLALTANRPPELRGSGANQTIDQVGLFGPHAREVVELGVATDPVAEHYHWRSAVGRAVLRALAPHAPGPVQVDLPFREPLVPGPGDEDWDPADPGTGLPAGRPGNRPWIARTAVGADTVAPDSARALDLTRPTLVVAGAGAGPVAELVGVPTVAEPGAPVPLHPVHPLVLDALRPEQVVVLGRPTLHRSVTRLLADPDVAHVVLGPGAGLPNPTSSAVDSASGVLTGWAGDPAWDARVAALDARAREVVAEHLRSGPATGLHVADAVARAVRPGDHLVVGASNPVRDLSLVGPLDPDVRVHANRGASGIDGTLSTAVGIALGVTGRTLALVGDLTFLHDVLGLCIGPLERRPRDLTIVVADDDGGGIFGLLEQGEPRLGRDFERVFGTPHGADLAALCAGFGVPVTETTPEGLAEVLDAPAVDGPRVVRVATVRTDLRALHAAIRAALADEPGAPGAGGDDAVEPDDAVVPDDAAGPE